MWHFKVTKKIARIFWCSYLLGLLVSVVYVNYFNLYGYPQEHKFFRFNSQYSASNYMYQTARMVRSLADQAMVGKSKLILLVGDSKLRGHGTTAYHSVSAQLEGYFSNDPSVAVLNLSRDGLNGITPYVIHEYILRFYPDTYLITKLDNYPRIKPSMEGLFTIYDIWATGKTSANIDLIDQTDLKRGKEFKLIALANRYFGVIDFGQSFRYAVAQLLYTDAVRYKQISIFQPIKTSKDFDADYYWHLDNPNYTEVNIIAEVEYWQSFSSRALDRIYLDEVFSKVPTAQWKKVILMTEMPVPYMRKRASLNGKSYKSAQDLFEGYYISKGANLINGGIVLQDNIDYSDMVHWSKFGAKKMAKKIHDIYYEKYN
ncbi:hypothetical protein FD975_01745 [Polynucleobacter sp. AP-Jannik-300A-C4]|uniref:hypothetical protein n=1 Tax=Polynucleobacter sp. AP-Jannik-300A-C4 TaxID=2576928 RepID=UPI001BFCE000|nr:hypothetical protein [Polynucleobacter sp. AP-Jannik-300A-C4]QWE22955.1 hypothetical protein FD975_01745 [Polynucleobacter sp. AP-Jannik-300A-C4]